MTEKPRRGNARAEERGVRRSTERCCKTCNSLVRLPGSATRRAATDPLCEIYRLRLAWSAWEIALLASSTSTPLTPRLAFAL